MTAQVIDFPLKAAITPKGLNLDGIEAFVGSCLELDGADQAKIEAVSAAFRRRLDAICGDGRRPVIDTASSFPEEVQRVADQVSAHWSKQLGAALNAIYQLEEALYDARRE